MKKILILIVMIVMFSGCSQKKPIIKKEIIYKTKYIKCNDPKIIIPEGLFILEEFPEVPVITNKCSKTEIVTASLVASFPS